jgi:RHS repeat-associated protein
MTSKTHSSFVAVSLLVLLVCSAQSQAQTNASRPDRGIMPGASYSVSDTENISLTNGNLNLTIPLASLPPIAGGKLKFGLNAIYNSKIWNVTRQQAQLGPIDGCASWVVSTPQLSDAGGWRIGTGYQLVFRDAADDFFYYRPNPPPPQDPCGPSSLTDHVLMQDRWSRLVLVTPDGAEHEMRPTDSYQPYPGTGEVSFLFNYYRNTPDTVGGPMRYYSFDGSYMWAVVYPSSSSTRWIVYMNDGTRIIQSSDGTQRMQDTNGNSVKTYYDTEGSHFQDEQTGREIKAVYDPNGNGGQGTTHVYYQTVGGAWHSVDINYGTTQVQGKVYDVEGWNPFGGETGGGMICHHNEQLWSELWVIREIVFPATEPGVPARRYTFSYNSDTTETATNTVHWSCGMPQETYTRQASKGLGILSQMTTPAGAVVNYSYSRDSLHYFIFEPDDIPRETITQKTVTHDGVTDTWNYSITEFSACAGTVTAPDGSTTSEQCFPRDTGAGSYFASTPKGGLPFRTTQADKVRVERHWSLLKFSGVNGNATGNFGETTVNPVVDAEYTSILDDTPSHNPIKMSAKTYQYDYNGNLLSETDYDWFDPAGIPRDGEGVPTGVPAGTPILRTMSNSFYNPASVSTSGNVYAKRNLSTALPLVLSALQQSTAGPSIIQLSYDGFAYGIAPTIGNVTSKSLWDDLDNKWITTSTAYNSYGNATSITDGRGKITNFYYDDSTHAAPTRVVVDPQNNTGLQTTTTAFDFYTGLPTSTIDVNGQLTTIDYTNQLLGSGIKDPFGRPGSATGPYVNVDGTNQRLTTVTKYFDSTRMVRTTMDLNAEGDGLLKSETLNDQLGRALETRQYESANTFIAVRQTFDDVNRIYKTSNPFRVTNGVPTETILWNTAVVDALGRTTSMTTPDNAVVSTSYDSVFTTIVDQTGKTRRSKVDGLGQVVRTDEPDASNNLGSTNAPFQPTSYDYDTRGNLLHVYQGSQTRTYTYDSLSRLRTATNPENGTITYQYDDNNNVVVRTDARGVSAHSDYDALNRIIRRWYNGSSAVNSVLHNSPALPAGVGTTDEAFYVYDTLAGNGKGRLTSVSTATSSFSYGAYDALGRATSATQTIFGQTNQSYTTSYTYDLPGHLRTLTYPSLKTITNTYDSTGRLISLTGSLGDGTTRTYSSGIVYNAGNRMTKEQFGTTIPIYNKLFYNSRGQLAEIREGTTYTGPNDTGWERGAIINHYSTSCWGMCGGSTSTTPMTDNNGNLKQQDHWIQDGSGNVTGIFTQQYEYDSMNRLQRVADNLSSPGWQQRYIYDRYGNRTVDQDPTKTFGAGIPKPNFTVSTTNNRLGVPGGQPGTMTYDSSGNLTTDTYSALAVTRTYDGENRMISETQANNFVAGLYSYDTDGRRVKRKVNGVETWQVYAVGGELIAEYAANAAAASPQKEYGYRNGQLLITAAFTAGSSGSPFSFTDDPISVGTTFIKGAHLNQLRTAVNQARTRANLPPATWAEVITDGVTIIKASHVTELRLRLDEARSALSLPPASYTDPNLTAGIFIKGAHIQELRTKTNEALTSGSTSTLDLRWLVSDQLGTPRIILDLSGSLANTSRHDYLPFGEELSGGSRTTGLGYGKTDGARQKFTSKERDPETGLDYFGARYLSSIQGRFISADPLYFQQEMVLDPQRFNLYIYARNNPLKWVDPNGERVMIAPGSSLQEIYDLVGGKEEFDKYFEIRNGEIFAKSGVDTNAANRGVQFLVELINRPQIFLVYLGADADSVARMFEGTVGKDGKLNDKGKKIAETFKNEGYIVRTAGRPGFNETIAGEAFTVLAIDPKGFSRTQEGDAGIAEFTSGNNQKVAAVSMMMHELAENLDFSIRGTHSGTMPNRKDKQFKGKEGKKLYDALYAEARGWNAYPRAHGFAQQYEIRLRQDLKGISGGFAGAVLGAAEHPKK